MRNWPIVTTLWSGNVAASCPQTTLSVLVPLHRASLEIGNDRYMIRVTGDHVDVGSQRAELVELLLRHHVSRAQNVLNLVGHLPSQPKRLVQRPVYSDDASPHEHLLELVGDLGRAVRDMAVAHDQHELQTNKQTAP